MFWNREKNETEVDASGCDQGFWEYVEKASDEVSNWSDWKKDGWSLVTDSDRSIYEPNSFEVGPQDDDA